MLDVREFLDDHESVNAGGEGVADTVDIVSSKIDEHDMLCPVLERVS